MSERLSISEPQREELWLLAGKLHDGILTADERDRLESLIAHDDDAAAFCASYADVHAMLRWRFRPLRPDAPESPRENGPATPSALIDNRPAAIVPVSVLQGSAGSFASGWPVAYLVATVICGLGLAIGALVHVSRSTGLNDPSPSVVKDRSAPEQPKESTSLPQMALVGRITGMVDCTWADPKTEAILGAYVPMNRRYALASGLMEITYDTGAKVILQGPVTYEVESAAGGYLSIGKLTARLEQRSEARGQRSEARGQRSEARGQRSEVRSQRSNPANQKSEIINQKSFAVRTPTALVTDLGTEFGVEVSKSGLTKTHVFRGSVRLERLAASGAVQGEGRVLHQNESASVGGTEGGQITMLQPSVTSKDFVLAMPKLRVKTFDLVDVVAGGNGYSGRRGAGIDPTDGKVTSATPKISAREGDGEYHHVAGNPFIDGVFIPDARNGQVQVDSAGHLFADFSSTANMTSHLVWAGGPVPIPADNLHTITFPTTLDGVDYAASDHGLLFLHANKAITFDLKAIRDANPGWKPVRLRAVAGNTENGSAQAILAFADVVVLFDGQVRFKRREINGYSGAMPISLPIRESDRFLTLAATDGGNGIEFDWIIFGDPRLELVSTVSEEKHP
jgi:hypothetical protein